ncbi:sialate O-acetylesterase [Niabella beijingensis]|uniref:sialate O-acetylesterase n=1 Tax=Niabella beijingensis TaxID=2872700 RepID=UPI001CBB2A58|nr:sialate O-acetylesterase [Niabella beijingensis]MBZ4191985.1 sialate O-acetylesterase [Niabella beijingensis]
MKKALLVSCSLLVVCVLTAQDVVLFTDEGFEKETGCIAHGTTVSVSYPSTGSDKITGVPDKNFHIYLCLGQSNMEGAATPQVQDSLGISDRFKMLASVDCDNRGRKMGGWYLAIPPLARCHTGLGPADYFGRTMVQYLPQKIKVGIVNVSVGGCKIELFDEDSCASYAAKQPDWMKNMIRDYGGSPYRRLVEMARLAQKSGIIKGILLHQGESNTGDTLWPQKVKKVYERLLHDLNLDAKEVPLLAGELVPEDQNGACAAMNKIIRTLPQTIATAHVVPSAGCQGVSDRLHFSAAGYRKLGKRYAAVMLELMGEKIIAE